MARLVGPALLLVFLLGCQALVPHSGSNDKKALPTGHQELPATNSTSGGLQLAHADMQAQTDDANRPAAKTALDRALDCLERGDDAAAADHFGQYVAQHPEQIVFRVQYAELCARLERLAEAQAEFEAVIAIVQVGPTAARKQLVRYHTRLMEIARLRANRHVECLNRGIGLLLLAEQLATKGEAEDAERLGCKAVAALKEAQAAHPDDARTAWYLYRVWSHLGQPVPAERSLRQALDKAPHSNLTRSEALALALSKSDLRTVR